MILSAALDWITFTRKKSNELFERLDRYQWKGKPFFTFYVPKWQFIVYFGIAIYFILTLFFLRQGVYEPNWYLAFFVLAREITAKGPVVNPILNRGLNNGGHILAYLSLVICAIVCRLKLPQNSKGFYFSILIPAFALSISEGLFNVFYYWINYPLYPHITWDIFILTNPLAVLYITVAATGFLVTPVTAFIERKKLIACIALIIGYFVIWSLFGLPVTLSTVDYFLGHGLDTKWYPNIPVNSTEIGQWILASFSSAWAVWTR